MSISILAFSTTHLIQRKRPVQTANDSTKNRSYSEKNRECLTLLDMPVTTKSLKWWYLLQPCKVVGAWWSKHGTPTQIKMEIWNLSTGREHHLVLEGCSEWRSTEVNTWTVLTVITLPLCFRETSRSLQPALIPQPCRVMKVRAQVTLGKKRSHKKAISFGLTKSITHRVYSFSLPLEQNLHR